MQRRNPGKEAPRARLFTTLSHPLERQLFELIYNKSLTSEARAQKLMATVAAINKVRELTLSLSGDASPQSAEHDFHPSLQVLDPATQNTPFIAAAEEGDLAAIIALRDVGIDLLGRNKYGNTALIAAMYKGQYDCLPALMAIPGLIDLPEDNEYGRTPLQIAIHYEDSEAIRLLTPFTDLTHSPSEFYQKPLMAAAAKGSLPLMRFLIESKKENGLEDVLSVQPESLYYFHYESVPVSYSNYYGCIVYRGMETQLTYQPIHHQIMTYASALREAIANGHLDCARYLLNEVYDEARRRHILKLLSYELRRPEFCDFSFDGTFLNFFKKFHEMLPYLDLLMANDSGLPTAFYDQSLFEGIYAGPLCIIIHAMAHHQLTNQEAILRLTEQTKEYPEAHRLLADVYASEENTALAEKHMQLASAGGDLIARKKLGVTSPALEEKTTGFFTPEKYRGRRERTTWYGVPSRSQRVELDADYEAPRFEIASLLAPKPQNNRQESGEGAVLTFHADPALRMK